MKVDKMVPEIYYQGSRDFGFLGRLFEITLNYMKTGAEVVGSNFDSDRVDPLTLELLCNTLGFTVKHKYITKDLVYVSRIFSELVRDKGSLDSIEEAVRVLLSSQNITDRFDVDFDEKTKTLSIILPASTEDIILLEDLFDYILPAGVIVEIAFASILKGKSSQESEIYYTDSNVIVSNVPDSNLGRIYSTTPSGMDSEEAPSDSAPDPEHPTDIPNYVKSIGYLGVIPSSTAGMIPSVTQNTNGEQNE